MCLSGICKLVPFLIHAESISTLQIWPLEFQMWEFYGQPARPFFSDHQYERNISVHLGQAVWHYHLAKWIHHERCPTDSYGNLLIRSQILGTKRQRHVECLLLCQSQASSHECPSLVTSCGTWAYEAPSCFLCLREVETEWEREVRWNRCFFSSDWTKEKLTWMVQTIHRLEPTLLCELLLAAGKQPKVQSYPETLVCSRISEAGLTAMLAYLLYDEWEWQQ